MAKVSEQRSEPRTAGGAGQKPSSAVPSAGSAASLDAPQGGAAPQPAPPRALPRGGDVDVRLDKWLHVARIFKTRTIATKACELSRVQVNGQVAKASRQVRLEDKIETVTFDWKRVLIVKALRDKPVPKAEAALLFEDLSGPRPEADPLKRLMRRAPVTRDKGAGRPTKKDRRDLQQARFDAEIEESEATEENEDDE